MPHDFQVSLSSGISYFTKEEYGKALAVFNFQLKSQPDNIIAMILRAYCMFKNNDIAGAEQSLNAAVRIDSAHPLLAIYHTKILADMGGDAKQNLRKLQDLIDSEYYYLSDLMETALNVVFPGNDYYKFLQMAHEILKPKTYLEIGVCTGLSIQYAIYSDIVIGVDVDRATFQVPAPPNLQMFYKTSTSFFSEDMRPILCGTNIDLTFIDGLHTYEQTLWDFIQIEKCCHDHSIAIFHDCLPLTKGIAQRETDKYLWTGWCGDVWKIRPILQKYRPDLTLTTFAAAPSGLLVVEGLDPDSRVLEDNLQKIREEFDPMEYSMEIFEDLLAHSQASSTEGVRRFLTEARR